jgi:hypothetical protein
MSQKMNKTKEQVADDIVVSITQSVSLLKKELKNKQVSDQMTIVMLSTSVLVGLIAAKLGIAKELDDAIEITNKLTKDMEKDDEKV